MLFPVAVSREHPCFRGRRLYGPANPLVLDAFLIPAPVCIESASDPDNRDEGHHNHFRFHIEVVECGN